MLLADIVETSRRIAETSKRLEKTDLLAQLLRRAHGDEIPIVVAWLSARTPQGRIGVGWRTLQEAAADPAPEATLEVADVDRRLAAIAATQGSGSERQRIGLVHDLLSKSTAQEQEFLTGLLMGELRQGALEGLMVDAVAKASGAAADRVRRACMMTGDVAVVARSVLEKGETALDEHSVQLFRPVQPMLAQTAGDIEEALEELGEAALEYKMDGARIQVHRSGDDVVVYSRRLNDV
ncbi:MAG TPA: ATP-dependent DNA ligase, partial [Bryobacteraceae bacterium]|nr:ATP-dependent DNA ligase [Bryobacteraceae bacterium]